MVMLEMIKPDTIVNIRLVLEEIKREWIARIKSKYYKMIMNQKYTLRDYNEAECNDETKMIFP